MKRFIICFAIALLPLMWYAQTGDAYKGTKRVSEKTFDVVQKYGRNILKLKSRATGYYDSTGTIVKKQIHKGNMTYHGKEYVNRGNGISETLSYNYMNLLNRRSVTIQGANEGELTELEYDPKGKIVSKVNTRKHATDGSMWQIEYAQLGYPEHYMKLNYSGEKIVSKDRYNYFDDLIEKHYLIYDANDHLIELYALSDKDSLLYKTIYVYDEVHNLTEEKLYDRYGRNFRTFRYYYDDKARMIQKNHIDWDPRYGEIPKLRTQTDYEYY